MRSPRALALALLALALLAPSASAQTTLDVEGHDGGGEFWFTLVGSDAKNPDLQVPAGAEVTVNFRNAGSIIHNFVLDAPLSTGIRNLVPAGGSASFTFTAPAEDASITYYCEPHRAAGMSGTLVVGAGGATGNGGGGFTPPDLSNIGPGSTAFGVGLAALVVIGVALMFTRDSRRPGQGGSGGGDEE